jgi:hypothetical protein
MKRDRRGHHGDYAHSLAKAGPGWRIAKSYRLGFRELEHDATTLPPFHYLTKICSHVDPALLDTYITICNRHSRIGSWECLHEGSISSVWEKMFNRQALPTFNTNVNFGIRGMGGRGLRTILSEWAVQLENVAKKR